MAEVSSKELYEFKKTLKELAEKKEPYWMRPNGT